MNVLHAGMWGHNLHTAFTISACSLSVWVWSTALLSWCCPWWSAVWAPGQGLTGTSLVTTARLPTLQHSAVRGGGTGVVTLSLLPSATVTPSVTGRASVIYLTCGVLFSFFHPFLVLIVPYSRVSQNFPNYSYVFSPQLLNVLDYSTTQKYEVWTSKATVYIALLPWNLV